MKNQLWLIVLVMSVVYPQVNAVSIHFMQNYDASEWEYVHLNPEKIEQAAKLFLQNQEMPDWLSLLPRGLSFEESVNYLLGLISIDFCHWGLKETMESIERAARAQSRPFKAELAELSDDLWQGTCHPIPERRISSVRGGVLQIQQFYVENEEGKKERGSSAMCLLAKRAYDQGIKLFEAALMHKMSHDQFATYFTGIDCEGNPMEIPMLQQRVAILNEIGTILLKKWNGSFLEVVQAADRRILNEGRGFVELLVQEFPRFQDEYFYRGKKVGIYKLAQLAVMALENAFSSNPDYTPFIDTEVLTLCADYQIPKSLHALGVLEYDPALAYRIEKEDLLEFGSLEEIELRMATVYAGALLQERINQFLEKDGQPLIIARALDYFLWSHGRRLESKHHLTRTIMY